ncbi:phage portal protein [Lutibacter holmesii]|uniref:Phage portal protein n=1 Tax=Lutibacter holmesii TaxID=1137985 RepID=A0ABW3WN41_9FLAO
MNLQRALQPLLNLRSAVTIPVDNGGFMGLMGTQTKNGVNVSPRSALTLSAFFNGIEIITNDFAKLPKQVFQKTQDGRVKIDNHPVQYLLSKRPNQYMGAFMFNKIMLQYAILKGNAFALIERNNYTSAPTAIQLVDQDQTPVQVLKNNNKLYYLIDGVTYNAEDVIHVPGFSFNGITGISVIQHAANSLGVSLSSAEFSAEWYNSKGIGTGIVTTTKEMTPDAKTRYAAALSDALTVASNSYKTAVIDEGASFQNIKITPQEAQFLATNKFGIEEVARFLNVPTHKLKSLDNTNNSITEQLEISHVSDSILPWAIKFDGEYEYKLFTNAEKKKGTYLRSNEAALLRADKKTQAEYFSKLVNAMIMKPAEARKLLELPFEEDADVLLQPVNTQTKKQFDAKLEISAKSKNISND